MFFWYCQSNVLQLFAARDYCQLCSNQIKSNQIKSNHSAQFRQQKLGGATKDFSDGSEIAFVSKV